MNFCQEHSPKLLERMLASTLGIICRLRSDRHTD